MRESCELRSLCKLVEKLYSSTVEGSDPWQRWCYKNHVLLVAKKAEELAVRYGADVTECVAGALLHDAADATMNRDDSGHEEESAVLSRRLLSEAGFERVQINRIIDEVIAPHSCKDRKPQVLEAKVLATADAFAHLSSDFYLYCAYYRIGGSTYDEFRQWGSAKIERDFHQKIFFDDVASEVRDRFLILKALFSSHSGA